MTRYKLNTLDLPSIHRLGVGFDRMFDELGRSFANSSNNYPPYNVVKHNDDSYELQIAVTGFDKDEVVVELDQNQLIIKGQHKDSVSETAEFLHRGLAARDFTRVFTLAEHMEVGEGTIKNGVLSINITRIIPETLKPRLIKITAEG